MKPTDWNSAFERFAHFNLLKCEACITIAAHAELSETQRLKYADAVFNSDILPYLERVK